MKTMKTILILLMISGCSFSNSKQEETATATDDLEFAVDTLSDTPEVVSDLKVEEEKIAAVVIPDEYSAPPVEQREGEQEMMTPPAEPTLNEFKSQEVVGINSQDKTKEAPARIVADDYSEKENSRVYRSETENYKMQKGDTLMMIAFKIYGDYRKWKDIKKWNAQVKSFKEGTIVKYHIPESTFGWAPEGLPYLVKTGDTLQIISMDKYGTTRRWKKIYENNRPLIRNANLIFAGFTLYYPPGRSLASEVK